MSIYNINPQLQTPILTKYTKPEYYIIVNIYKGVYFMFRFFLKIFILLSVFMTCGPWMINNARGLAKKSCLCEYFYSYKWIVDNRFKQACLENDVDLVAKFIDYGVDMNLGICLASQNYKSKDVLSYLIKRGADINVNVYKYIPGIHRNPQLMPLLISVVINRDIQNISLILNNPNFSIEFIKKHKYLTIGIFSNLGITQIVESILKDNKYSADILTLFRSVCSQILTQGS